MNSKINHHITLNPIKKCVIVKILITQLNKTIFLDTFECLDIVQSHDRGIELFLVFTGHFTS